MKSNCPCCKNIDNNIFLYKLTFGKILRCSNCKVIFTSFRNKNYIKNANMSFTCFDFVKSRLYDQYYLRNIARKRLRVLSSFLKYGNLLEFGASTGEFLREAATAGYNISGFDLKNIVLNINKANGVNKLIVGDVLAYNGKEKYDGIVGFHLLEHLDEPAKFLLNCRNMLASKGVIFMEVPNFNDITRMVLGKYWTLFFDYHICHYNIDALRALFSKCGFEPLFIRSIDDNERYVAYFFNPIRNLLWRLISKFPKMKNNKNTYLDECFNYGVSMQIDNELKLLTSHKAKLYRIEKNIIRILSIGIKPFSYLLSKLGIGSGIQIVARKND